MVAIAHTSSGAILVLVAASLLAAASPATADWTTWSIGPGSGPACWANGHSLAFVAPLADGPALVACRWDGSGARAMTGPRSRLPEVLVQAGDTVETDREGGLALVGDRLLVSLVGTGYVDLTSAAGLPADSRPRDATLSGDGRTVALLDPEGHLMSAPVGLPLTFTAGLSCPEFSGLRLDRSGGRCLLLGDGKVRVVGLASGEVLCDASADAAALSGDGGRLAYVVGGELRRRNIADGTETVVPLGLSADLPPSTVWGIEAADWGRRVVIGIGAGLWESSWSGEVLRPLATCAPGSSFRVAANGATVVFASGGLVCVASSDVPEAPPLVPLAVPYARGPDAAGALESLAELLEATPEGSQANMTGLAARDTNTGWALYQHEEPRFTVRVPPDWHVIETDAGVRLADNGGRSVEVVAAASSDEDVCDALSRMGARLGISGEPRAALLGGVPAISVRGTLPDGGRVSIWCARWSGGFVTVEARWPDSDAPEVLLQAIESLSLEAWAPGDRPG